MVAPNRSADFDFADILASEISEKTNNISVQTGDVVGEEVEGPSTEWWQQVGFASRPAVADPGKAAAQCLVVRRSDRDVAVCSKDVRGQEIYGNLAAGEACIYAPGGKCRVLLKADESVVIATQAANGASVTYSFSGEGMDWNAPWGRIQWGPEGLHITHVSGAEFHLGGIGGIPKPFDVIASYIKMSAGTVQCAGATTQIGVGPYVQCATTLNPLSVPSPTNPTGGSGSVHVST